MALLQIGRAAGRFPADKIYFSARLVWTEPHVLRTLCGSSGSARRSFSNPMGAASKTVGLAGANPAPEIGRFNRVTGSTWDEETNPKQARATKPSSRITAWERPGGQVNGRVVIEENACSVESRRPREVACGRPGSAPNHPSVVKAVVTWDETDHTHQVRSEER